MAEQSYGDWIRSNPPLPTKRYKKEHMAQFRKKPVVIDAVQFDGDFRDLDCFPIEEVRHFRCGIDENNQPCIKIPTLEGVMIASVKDYIIRGVMGEYYPCKPNIFEMTYELVK